MGGRNGNKLLSRQRKTDTRWKRRWRERESIVLLLTFKALKWNVFTITVYREVIFMLRFRQSANDRYQSISIYLSIVIENRYQSITTRIFAIDWSSITNINRLTDIDCQRLYISQFQLRPVPRPPGYGGGICPPCQSWRWGICKFCTAWGPGICQPRGH